MSLIDKNESYQSLLSTRNREGVADNQWQNYDIFKRVLFVCSAGILRSATAAHIFSADPYNWNTRTVGSNAEYALNLPTVQLLHWADEIYFMEMEHYNSFIYIFGKERLERFNDKMFVMTIADIYSYRDSELVAELKHQIDNKTFRKISDMT
jgi:predicted protein tyrosine phosphatase